jgi:hypothetical protein
MYLPNVEIRKKGKDSVKFYLDFNKTDNTLYNNLYLEEYNLVIRTQISERYKKIKVEYFSIENGIFLTSY